MRAKATVNKRTAIKHMLARLGMQASSGQVVEALDRYGIIVSEKFVSRVKSQMYRDQAKGERERAKRPPKTKSRNRPQQRKIPHRG